MKMLPDHTAQKIAWLLLFLLLIPAFAFAGVPLEVGLYKSSLLKLNKKMVLVTLANTKKDDTEKDAQIVAKSDKMDVEKRRDSGASNTNKFVTVEILSPFDLKIDGITIGSTSMIIWTKADEDEKPQPTFYDVKVTGDRSAIETQIKELGSGDDITVQYAHDTVILSGSVAKEQTKAKAEKIALAFAPKVLNNLEITDTKQVLLEVKVAQIDKTSLKKLGLSYLLKGSTAEGFVNNVMAPNTNKLNEGVVGNLTSVLGAYNPLDTVQIGASYFPGGVGAILQALSTKGYAKILAEPNLLVKSGQEGSFLAGSKIPYNIVTSTGGTSTASVVFVDVGVKLKFKPEVSENSIISLKIDPAEVSTITGTLAVNGYPIIDTREVRSNVELKDGESFIMAGLLQEEQIKTMSKIPLLGDIPILGALFRSTQDDLKEKELVFFITPRIIKPMARGEKPLLPTDKKLTQEQEDELKWMPLGH